MASFSGMIGGCGSNWLKEDSKIMRKRNDRFRVCSSSSSSSYSDPYKTLRIHRGASETEVKKAFRKLALQVGKFVVLFIIILFLFLFSPCSVILNLMKFSVSSRRLQRKQLWRPISPN